jgi:hypothetical protein
MSIGLYGILIVLGLFIILLVFNPNISCFGKRVKSPFYPLFRKKSRSRRKMKTEDYGFELSGGKDRTPGADKRIERKIPVEDYGFDLGGTGRKGSSEKESGPKDKNK